MAENREASAAAEPQTAKIGAGALKAAMRMGFKELAQALPAFPDSMRPVEEPGALGNITPQQAAEQQGYNPMQGSAHRAQYQSQDHDLAR